MNTATLLALTAAGLIALGSPHAEAGVRGRGIVTDGRGDATGFSGAAGATHTGTCKDASGAVIACR